MDIHINLETNVINRPKTNETANILYQKQTNKVKKIAI